MICACGTWLQPIQQGAQWSKILEGPADMSVMEIHLSQRSDHILEKLLQYCYLTVLGGISWFLDSFRYLKSARSGDCFCCSEDTTARPWKTWTSSEEGTKESDRSVQAETRLCPLHEASWKGKTEGWWIPLQRFWPRPLQKKVGCVLQLATRVLRLGKQRDL